MAERILVGPKTGVLLRLTVEQLRKDFDNNAFSSEESIRVGELLYQIEGTFICLTNGMGGLTREIEELKEFYVRVFKLPYDSLNISKLEKPPLKKGIQQFMFRPKGLSYQKILEEINKQFLVCAWGCGDITQMFEIRNAAKDHYCFFTAGDEEANCPLLGMDIGALDKPMVMNMGMTPSEYLLLYLFHWWRNGGKYGAKGKRLDTKNITVCLGGKFTSGYRPAFYTAGSGRLFIIGYLPGEMDLSKYSGKKFMSRIVSVK